MPESLLLELRGEVDLFLATWTENMDRAGYLPATTTKQEDCILSCKWFMELLWEMAADGGIEPDFSALLKDPGSRPDRIPGR